MSPRAIVLKRHSGQYPALESALRRGAAPNHFMKQQPGERGTHPSILRSNCLANEGPPQSFYGATGWCGASRSFELAQRLACSGRASFLRGRGAPSILLKSSGTRCAIQRTPEGATVPDACLKWVSGTTPPHRSPSRASSVPDLLMSMFGCLHGLQIYRVFRSCLNIFSEKKYGDILRQIKTTVFSSLAPQKSEHARFCSVCRRFSS